ncbi:MAG: GGDEF domain-containing protein [Deltaproteobacteria bacterium]|nr:GGDEF domain-containing protein [Deltaproteobacteria bacterium]
MMNIDLATVLMLELASSLTALLILAAASQRLPSSGLNDARGAMLALVPAFALQLEIVAGFVPEALAVTASNVFFWTSAALIFTSYARFAGATPPPRWPAAFVAGATVVFTALFHFGASHVARASFASLTIAVLLTASLVPLAREGGFRKEPSRRVSFLLILLVALPLWARFFLLVTRLRDDIAPLIPTLETALGFVPAVLLVQGYALAFLTMQRERGEALAEERAIVDELTSCLNRRALEERVRSELAYQARLHRPFAVLVVDLDQLQQINDEHGRAAGDAVLIAVAAALRMLLRPSDVVARSGAGEFCLLLRDSDVDTASAVAERVCATMRATPVAFARKSISLTVSVGVAGAAEGEDWQTLFRRLEAAVRRAKQEGRNRCVAAVPPSTSPPPPTAPPGDGAPTA